MPLKENSPDFAELGRGVDLDLLRAIALGGKGSAELKLLLDAQAGERSGQQALALAIADLSLPEEAAAASFATLRQHQERLRATLGRDVGVRVAALDLLENVERALKVEDESQRLSYFQLEQMAYRDQLTGLRNFRYFYGRLNEELQRAKRYRHQLSLVMIDIDHFKRFNDTHGHQAGNQALQALSSVLVSTARETDIVARYGGEEFAVVLPETTKRLAAEWAERLRGNVEAQAVVLGSAHHRITISLGLATFPRDAHTQESLVECADRALYLSKQAGRNQLSLYTPPTTALFRYRPAPEEKVYGCAIVGSFNGWDAQADPMHPTEDGAFWAKVGLVPGTYEYKFVVGGEKWIADPLNAERISDGYWGHNSVLHVKA